MHQLDGALETQLRQRIKEQIACEVTGNVAALYESIDPDIRASREGKFPFEPECTISQLHDFIKTVQRAEVESIEIEGFRNDGGEIRQNRPTAFVAVNVLYNGRTRSRFRTPWVLDGGQWYSRSLGKIAGPAKLIFANLSNWYNGSVTT
jgi:hypothetical protein